MSLERFWPGIWLIFHKFWLKKKKEKKEKKKNGLINLYYIHFRITGSPFNLSGSH